MKCVTYTTCTLLDLHLIISTGSFVPVQRNVILYIDLIACDLAKPFIRSSGFLVDSLESSMYIIYVYN